MARLPIIKGFFYADGSTDRPFGYNDNLNFGFDYGSQIPKFKYSVNGLLDFYNNPVKLIRTSLRNTIMNLVVEKHTNESLVGISNSEFESKNLHKLLNILEYIQVWDGGINTPSHQPEFYNSFLDESLSGYTEFDGIYVPNSLRVYESVYVTGRISRAVFDIKVGTDIQGCEIYFVPDDMLLKYGLEFEGTRRYDIRLHENKKSNSNAVKWNYVKEDVTVPTTADTISESMKDIFEDTSFMPEISDNYKNLCVFVTRHVVFDSNRVKIDEFQQQFFIYNHFFKGYVIPSYLQTVLVKTYLEEKYTTPTGVDRTKLKEEYPDLFTDMDVDVYPMLSNMVDGDLVLPFRLEDVKAELERRGSSIQFGEDTNNVEIVLLEGVSKLDNQNSQDLVNNFFRIPLIFVDSSVTATSGPIGKSYPRFSIMATGMLSSGEDWEFLHFLFKLFMKVLLNILPGDFNKHDDHELSISLGIPSFMSFKTARYHLYGTSYISKIMFTFGGITYCLHGFNYEALYGPEQLS